MEATGPSCFQYAKAMYCFHFSFLHFRTAFPRPTCASLIHNRDRRGQSRAAVLPCLVGADLPALPEGCPISHLTSRQRGPP